MTHATSFTQNQSQIWLKILFLNFMLSSLALKWMWNLLKVLTPDEYTLNAPGWANASLECVMFCQNKASAHQLFKWMHILRLHTSYKNILYWQFVGSNFLHVQLFRKKSTFSSKMYKFSLIWNSIISVCDKYRSYERVWWVFNFQRNICALSGPMYDK